MEQFNNQNNKIAVKARRGAQYEHTEGVGGPRKKGKQLYVSVPKFE